ncbi:MAG: hypothetical protein AAGA10_29650 [Bacteroidota bacterium]
MMFSIALEEGRREAGQHPIHAPVLIHSITHRDKRSIWELKFDVSQVDFSLEGLPAMPMAGDVLGVFPKNKPEEIAVLRRGLVGLDIDKIFLKGRYETDPGQFYTVEEALELVSLNPAKIELLQVIEKRLKARRIVPAKWLSGCKMLLLALGKLRKSEQSSRDWLKHIHVADLIEAFPGLLTLQEICEIQGAIYRRVYTLSGIDRNADGDPISLRILLATGVSYKTPEDSFGRGRTREGTSSAYLQYILEEKKDSACVEVFVQRRKFGSPEKDRHCLPQLNFEPKPKFLSKLRMPLLMIAAGSGISGIRAILEEREAWKRKGYKVGSATLVFGLQCRHKDYLYEEDVDRYVKGGLIDRVLLAESRPLTGRKRYVQHLMMEGNLKKELREVKLSRRSLVLCGDWKMGQGVLQGCLPFIFAAYSGAFSPNYLFDLPQSALEDLFLDGQKQVLELKTQGIIRVSASGSRYKKTELTCEDALEGLRRIGLRSWDNHEDTDKVKMPTSS